MSAQQSTVICGKSAAGSGGVTPRERDFVGVMVLQGMPTPASDTSTAIPFSQYRLTESVNEWSK
jgi:hypothetical protein